MAKLILAILLALAVSASLAAPKSKVNAGLQQKMNKGALANIMVSLTASTHTILRASKGRTYTSRDQKLTTVTHALQQHAAETQAPILAALTSFPFIEVKPFWVSNQIYVGGANGALVARLASMDEVAEIHEEIIVQLDEPINYSEDDGPITPNAEWGINNIKGPEAWALGYTGENCLIATIDTGARGSHETLRDNYRGTYGWFDPYQGTAAPNDQNGHGSHTTANICGKLGVGVAPSAKWMACKGCSTSSCTEAALIACGQFVACPTWSDGSQPDCTKAPHLCSNSWGGGQADAFYNDVIAAWHALDITPVFAIGNSGPLCSTANSPGDQDVLSVGATTAPNGLALFSSKGPSIENVLKPDVSAPGEGIRSASHTGDAAYASNSGTSMACPHVAGVVALVKSIDPDISYDDLLDLIFSTSTKDVTPTTRNCGGIDTSTFPNNSYGYGKVNAENAVRAAAARKAARK